MRSTRSLPTLLAGLVVAGLALAPPLADKAMAATWAEDVDGHPTYTGIAHELTEPSTGKTTLTRYFYRVDGSPDWSICQQVDTDDSTTHFDSNNCQQFRGGNAFSEGAGSSYRAPTSIGTSTMSVRWQTSLGADYTTVERRPSYHPDDEALAKVRLTRTLIEAGRPAQHASFANFPPSYWWNPAESGRGVFMDMQGTSALLLFYGYADNGQAEWRLATGAMTDATNGSFAFNRCTKSGSTVSCSSEGTVSIQLVTIPAVIATNTPAQYRLQVTLPSGRVETLQRYRF